MSIEIDFEFRVFSKRYLEIINIYFVAAALHSCIMLFFVAIFPDKSFQHRYLLELIFIFSSTIIIEKRNRFLLLSLTGYFLEILVAIKVF
jgi:hypothetical protein